MAVLGLVGLVLLGGLWLAQRRSDIPYVELESRYAAADSDFFETADGVRVHYREQGRSDAPALLLLHGFGVSSDTWEPWAAELGANYRLVSVDLPGHGLTYSPRDWPQTPERLIRLLDALVDGRGMDRFTLVGQGLGADLAWRYARRHAGKVQGLVLVSPSGWSSGDPAATRFLGAAAHPVGALLLRETDRRDLIRSGLRAAYADDARATNAAVTRYAELARAPGHRDAVLDLANAWRARPPATAADLRELRAPVLILQGSADEIASTADARRFQSAIPRSRLVLYPGAGHLVNEERASRTAADVFAFVSAYAPPPVGAPPPTGVAAGRGLNSNDPLAGLLVQ
jgi:pimeloyl-ACP methyl ester carboxylesterase